ncbi:PR domain zinc finger protein 13-like isoform X2 [Tachypleus tridentatus]|uniref:PR domain zinc finger protein 13-like isoform X2 n=1 Tax=Tachypleus tridentatus TaxID=6853 RepID=UPI003FD25BBF
MVLGMDRLTSLKLFSFEKGRVELWFERQNLTLHGTQLWKRNKTIKTRDETGRPMCPMCWKTFFDMSNLRRHMEIHDPYRSPHSCSVCKKKFAWKTHLATHMRSEHPGYQ